MATLKIPTPLRPYANGQSEVRVHGATASQALQNLVEQHPALQPHLYNSQGGLRPFVNLFVGADNIKDLQGLDTILAEDSQLRIIPSIAGGTTDSAAISFEGIYAAT